jgi:hypothetical protein
MEVESAHRVSSSLKLSSSFMTMRVLESDTAGRRRVASLVAALSRNVGLMQCLSMRGISEARFLAGPPQCNAGCQPGLRM